MEAERLELVDDCPLCGRPAAPPFLQQGDSLFPTGVLRLVQCSGCSLVFLNPRMTMDAIARLEDASEVYEFAAEDREREIEARMSLVRGLGGKGSSGRTLLDVGCNRGFLLAAAKRLGWRPVGVELSPVAAQLARESVGVPVHDDLANVEPPPGGFDLVIAWHVLEHTTDPVRFLEEIKRLVGANGAVALQMPSFDFADRFREQERITSLICAVHNLCFGEASLRVALERAGFSVVWLVNNKDDLMLTAFAELRRPHRRLHSLQRPGRALLSRGGRRRFR